MSDSAQTGPHPSRPRWMLAVGIALLLLLIAAAVWWLFFAKPQKLDVWHEAKVPYSKGCEGDDCKPWRSIAPAHGGDGGKGPPPQLVYNPKIDDAVAQWGDCLQSIMSCVVKLKRDDDKGMRNCVAVSICPKACKERFAGQAGNGMDASEKAFYSVFTDEDAVCRPEEP